MTNSENLWPEDLLENLPTSPIDIIRQQAQLLGGKTNNIVLAEATSKIDNDGDFVIKLFLRVPTMGNYRYEIFDIWHGMELYPVKQAAEVVAKDEASLKIFLKNILASEKTVNLIRSLVSQYQSLPDNDVPY